MIRPAGGSWFAWACNLAAIVLGAVLNVVGSAIDALRR